VNPTESSSIPAGGVESCVYYISPTSRINRRYVSPAGQINLSEYEPRQVFVRNARPMAAQITLDTHGFALARHVSAVTDFRDKAQIDRVYIPEMVRLAEAQTGAGKIIPFAWMMRSSSPSGEEQPPANDVHADQTPGFADCMAQRALAWAGEPNFPFRRFLVINVWRAYSGAPQDWPLGLCDGTSVADDEGITYPIVSVDKLPPLDDIPEVLANDMPQCPEIAAFQFRPEHRWYYFPEMGVDEVVVFKNHDSAQAGAWRVPHAGLRDPSCAPTKPRLSIEVRLLAFFV
jgi:hypothetical protein